MYSGKTVFAQLMMFGSEYYFKKCVDRYGGDYRVRKLSCREQFLTMSFAQLTSRESLRDIENCLVASGIPKSTLADANESRDWRIYADYAQCLIRKARPLYFDDPEFRLDMDNMVYALDSTTIDLCLSMFPWAKFRKTKGAVKMHTLLDLRGSIPIYIDITTGSVHDVNILDTMPIEPGSYYIMDKGYTDFKRLYQKITTQNAFFVTRAKDNLNHSIIERFEVDKNTGILEDKLISLDGFYTSKKYPEVLRVVTYENFSDGTLYNFMTNDFSLEAITIAELYKDRWKIELFFKWIKGHLKIKTFYGTSENAVKCQIWIAICTYLIAAIAKKKLELKVSLYTFTQTIGLTLFEKLISKNYLVAKNILIICPTILSCHYGKVKPDSRDVYSIKGFNPFNICNNEIRYGEA